MLIKIMLICVTVWFLCHQSHDLRIEVGVEDSGEWRCVVVQPDLGLSWTTAWYQVHGKYILCVFFEFSMLVTHKFIYSEAF